MNENVIYGKGINAVSNSVFVALMRKVYLWMTLALCVTGLTAFYVAQDMNLAQVIMENNFLFWGLIIAELGLVYFISARILSLSFATASLLFVLYSILNGVTLSFIFLAYTMTSIASAFFITAGMFGVMSLIGFVTKKDLSTMGRFLIMGLVGMIIASVVNIFLKNDTMHWIISYLGVFIFVGLTAYDTQKIKMMLANNAEEVNETSQKLAILGSLTLYLDFINLFLYILRFFDRD